MWFVFMYVYFMYEELSLKIKTHETIARTRKQPQSRAAIVSRLVERKLIDVYFHNDTEPLWITTNENLMYLFQWEGSKQMTMI